MAGENGTNHDKVTLLSGMGTPPPIFDLWRAEHGLKDLKKAALQLSDEGNTALEKLLVQDDVQKLLSSLCGNAPYLTRLALRYPENLPDLLTLPPEDVLKAELDFIYEQSLIVEEASQLMTMMRQAKAKLALLTALADISHVWDLFQVTGALTQLADICLQASLRFLFTQAAKAGRFQPHDESNPEKDCGLFIVAMGKYGAGELNYSSDIDITVFFDEGKVPISSDVEVRQFCVRVTKELVRMMQEVTADGYVFRTDLRLRPDAGATAVAMSMAAAELYYEGMGQNWERAAMIKSRASAGDMETAESFKKTLQPFIWRKYLDYAAIEDIHSIKRQIHSHGGHKTIAVAGHNVKLGLGGIREIEFFVQTQQLIMGGRDKTLRNPTTCGALADLAAAGLIKEQTCHELKESYVFLRHVEHRLQMKEDAQTHVMPKDAAEIDNIARFSGYEKTEDFEKELLFHLRRVNGHYNDLFSQEEALSGAEGSLVFTGVEDDPDTLETLRSLGFSRPQDVTSAVRGWHFGRIRATRSERARALLTKLLPALLEAISKTSDPDTTFARFRDFLSGLPSGVQLFSLFYSHAELLSLLTDALGTAPRLGPYLAQNASIFDSLLDTDFLTGQSSRDELAEELRGNLSLARDYEDALDRSRRWGKDQAFRIGLQVLRGVAPSEIAGPAYADLADVFIQGLAPLAMANLAEAHGPMEGADYAVVAMGKAGGRELSATSDLDLVVIYDVPEEVSQSSGPKPIDPTRYFTRFTQRFIAALSAPTAEGTLYEVDMQLRPSGKAGPVATKFKTYERYYTEEAWTWEKMALTRARLVMSTGSFGEKVQESIHRVLCSSRDQGVIAQDICDMRAKLVQEKPSDNPWELKQVRGGLVDLEFIAQYLQLVHAAKHPEVLSPTTVTCFEQMGSLGILPPETVERLRQAAILLQNLVQVTRIAVSDVFKPEEAGESLRQLLATNTGEPDFESLEKDLLATQSFVHESFETIITRAVSP